jgi:DNA-binding NtrC family response regulator
VNTKPYFLIAESECIIAAYLKSILESMGFSRLKVTGSFEDTMRTLDKKRTDLVIFDTILNGCNDGVRTATLISKMYDIPVILLNDFDDQELIPYQKLYDAFYAISKPFDPQELRLIVEIALLGRERKNHSKSTPAMSSYELERKNVLELTSMGI